MMTRKTFYKTLFICFSLLLAVTLMFACAPLLESQYGDIAYDGGITMTTQYNTYSDDVETIQVIMTNKSGADVEFGSMWTIEKADGDKWMTVPFASDTAWNAILYMLDDGGSHTFTVHTSMLDSQLTNGLYRIVKVVGDVPVAAEFTVGASNVTADSPYGYKALESIPDGYSRENAIEDGVVMLDQNTAFETIDEFFADIDCGASAQLRYGEILGDELQLTDVIVEYKLGTRRILCREMTVGGEVSEWYYSFFTVDGDNICLSNAVDDANFIVLDGITWEGRESVIDCIDAYNAQQDKNYAHKLGAIYWSDDGMRQVTLYSDEPLSFAYGELYKAGGSAGHIADIGSVDGVTAISSVRFTEAGITLVCETGSGDMMGYVHYDPASMKVVDSEIPQS